MDEEEALVGGDMLAWAEVCANRGDVLPTDSTILENIWLLRRMRCRSVPVITRMQCRNILKERNVVMDEPISVLEKLMQKNVAQRMVDPVKKLVQEAEEVILLHPNMAVRNRSFMRVSEELRGTLDMKRSSVVRMELYTIQGTHVKFLVDDEDYELPNKKTILKVINSVL